MAALARSIVQRATIKMCAALLKAQKTNRNRT